MMNTSSASLPFDPSGRSHAAQPTIQHTHGGYQMPVPPVHDPSHHAASHSQATAGMYQFYPPAPTPAQPYGHTYVPSSSDTNAPFVATMQAASIPPPSFQPPASFDPMQFYSSAAGGGGGVAQMGLPPQPPTQHHHHHNTDPNFDAEAELLFLNKLEKKAYSLQQKGHHLYAIELMEQSVASRKLLYGPLSEEVMVAAEKLALLYNSLAMSSLYKEEYKQSLRLLRKSELLTSHISQLTSVRVQTLNNLACCYRRLQRPKTALNLLRESLVLLSAEHSIEGRPVTHLNMCAILSQLHRHEEALEHAKAAVMWCQKQLLQAEDSSSGSLEQKRKRREKEQRRRERREYRRHQNLLAGIHDTGENSEDYSSSSESDNDSTSTDPIVTAQTKHQQLTEKIVILGIAYHNLGVEEEFLKDYQSCLEWYGKALQLAKEHIGEKEEITKTFRESFQAAKKQIDFLAAQSASKVSARMSQFNQPQQPTRGSSRSSSRPASARSARSGLPGGPTPPPANPSSSSQRSSSTVRSRPSSAAPFRPERPSSASQQQQQQKHYASTTDFSRSSSVAQPPAYLQSTVSNSSRQRPKSASISRPPRPR